MFNNFLLWILFFFFNFNFNFLFRGGLIRPEEGKEVFNPSHIFSKQGRKEGDECPVSREAYETEEVYNMAVDHYYKVLEVLREEDKRGLSSYLTYLEKYNLIARDEKFRVEQLGEEFPMGPMTVCEFGTEEELKIRNQVQGRYEYFHKREMLFNHLIKGFGKGNVFLVVTPVELEYYGGLADGGGELISVFNYIKDLPSMTFGENANSRFKKEFLLTLGWTKKSRFHYSIGRYSDEGLKNLVDCVIVAWSIGPRIMERFLEIMQNAESPNEENFDFRSDLKNLNNAQREALGKLYLEARQELGTEAFLRRRGGIRNFQFESSFTRYFKAVTIYRLFKRFEENQKDFPKFTIVRSRLGVTRLYIYFNNKWERVL